MSVANERSDSRVEIDVDLLVKCIDDSDGLR